MPRHTLIQLGGAFLHLPLHLGGQILQALPRQPALAQRAGKLIDLFAGKRLAQHDHIVTERLLQLIHVVIGKRRGNDDVDRRVQRPQRHCGLQAIPAGRHAHVDERDLMRPARSQRQFLQRCRRFALGGLGDLELRRLCGSRCAGYQRFQRAQTGAFGAQYLAIGLADGGIVIHHQNTKNLLRACIHCMLPDKDAAAASAIPEAGAKGRTNFSVAPRMRPGLSSETLPPTSRANSAAACRP